MTRRSCDICLEGEVSGACQHPQVLRLADTDEKQCETIRLAYVCSEKRKVRTIGATTTPGGAAGDPPASLLKACKLTDRTLRKATKPRVVVSLPPKGAA